MSIVGAPLGESLVAGAARLGVPLDAEATRRFDRYLELLLRWNARIKLTSVTDPAEVVERHFLDSLAIVPELGDAATLVDVGAGAGFPGLVTAIVRPGLRVTAVESIQKKCAFLEAVKRELGLSGVEVIPDRMEALVRSGRQFDVAVSRATFAPAEWVVRGTPLVAPGGRLIAMVVPGDGVSVATLAPAWRDAFGEAVLREAYAPGRALLVLSRRLGPSPPA